MKESSTHPKVESSGTTPPPSFIGTTSGEASANPIGVAVADVPPPFTSDDSNIRRMLETVINIQVAYGQILVDMLDELRAWQADLEHLRQSPLPPPFDDGL